MANPTLVQSKPSTALGSTSQTNTWTAATTLGNFLAASTMSDVSGLVAYDNTLTGNGSQKWTLLLEKGTSAEGFTTLQVRANAPVTTSAIIKSGDFVQGAFGEYNTMGTSATANCSGSNILATASTSETCVTTTGSGNASDLVLLAVGDFSFQGPIATSTTGYAVDVQTGTSLGDCCALISNKGNAASGAQSCTITGPNSQKYPYVMGSYSAAAGGAPSGPNPTLTVVRQAVARASTW